MKVVIKVKLKLVSLFYAKVDASTVLCIHHQVSITTSLLCFLGKFQFKSNNNNYNKDNDEHDN